MNLKKEDIFFITICIAIVTLIVGFIVYVYIADRNMWNEMYKDRVEYPLAKVDINDNSTYMLVKRHFSPVEIYEIITDTQAIKDNKYNFSVDNIGTIYGTTPDGVILLFKDGEVIDTVLFDNTYTKKIEYGTLQFQQVNQLQYQLLIGYEIALQGESYSILRDNRSEIPYYYCFRHGDDLQCIETVYLIDSNINIDNIVRP